MAFYPETGKKFITYLIKEDIDTSRRIIDVIYF
jgi:hypothetical protein